MSSVIWTSAVVLEVLQSKQRVWLCGADRRRRHESIRNLAQEHAVPLYWVSAQKLLQRCFEESVVAAARTASQQQRVLAITDWERVIAWHRLFWETNSSEVARNREAAYSLVDEPEEVLTSILGSVLEPVPVAVVVSCSSIIPCALRWFFALQLEQPARTMFHSNLQQARQPAGASTASNEGELVHVSGWRHQYNDHQGALARLGQLLLPSEVELSAWKRLALSRPRCVLVHGPPASGKTALLYAFCDLAAERGVLCHYVCRSSLYSGFLGETERHLRKLCRPSERKPGRSPPILCFDDIDLLLLRGRGAGDPHPQAETPTSTDRFASRLLGTLLSEVDGALEQESEGIAPVRLLLTVTDIASLDAALLRPGRCDARIELSIDSVGSETSPEGKQERATRRMPTGKASLERSSPVPSAVCRIEQLRRQRCVFWDSVIAESSTLPTQDAIENSNALSGTPF